MLSHSNDTVKCSETLQKLIELRRAYGSRSQLIDALSLLLPGSSIYEVISTLPPPDPTNPTASTTVLAQTAIHDSLPLLQEIVALVERDEEERIKNDLRNRRMRLGESSQEQLRKEVEREVLGSSRVNTFSSTSLLPP